MKIKNIVFYTCTLLLLFSAKGVKAQNIDIEASFDTSATNSELVLMGNFANARALSGLLITMTDINGGSVLFSDTLYFISKAQGSIKSLYHGVLKPFQGRHFIREIPMNIGASGLYYCRIKLLYKSGQEGEEKTIQVKK